MKIQHSEGKNKFFIEKEDKECFLQYEKPEKDVMDFKSTFVPKELRGGGIATKLVKHGLEYAAQYDYKVIPSCPFVEFVMENHKEEYGDLLAEAAKEDKEEEDDEEKNGG